MRLLNGTEDDPIIHPHGDLWETKQLENSRKMYRKTRLRLVQNGTLADALCFGLPLSKAVDCGKLKSESEAVVMKRCPDCGFRAKEDIRLCPLCGVRMMYDPNGKAVEKKLHNHTERGEPCFLSDRQAQPPKSRKPEQKQVVILRMDIEFPMCVKVRLWHFIALAHGGMEVILW